MSARSFRLTERDGELLALLYCHHLMLARQLVALGFFGSLVRCNARLRKLREAGYVRKGLVPSIRGTQAVHRLAAKAAPIVAERLGIEQIEVRRTSCKGFSVLQLEHTVRVSDLRIQCEQSAAFAGLEAEWTPECQCRHEYSVRRGNCWQKRVLKPDGLLRLISDGCSRFFFIEVDLGNTSHKRFRAKIASYQQYASGVFQQTYGEDGFTVLTVTTGARRLSRLAALVKTDAPQFLFTTFDELMQSSPFDSIWTLPGKEERVSLTDKEVSP